MIAHKHIDKFIIAIIVTASILCLLASFYSNSISAALGGSGVTMEYETTLFDTSEVMEVNIIMDEDSFNEMLNNAMSEEYYVCDVEINGEKVGNVGIRPKGNTSLSAIAMNPDENRYSFKLEFGHYVDGQTCCGLDKLILNNNYADATNMKEAVIYDMFNFLGVDSSLYNYAKVSVNGEYYGVYLALEAVEQSFMLRNYGTQDGELYKPDSMEMGGNADSGDGKSGGFGGMTPPSGFFDTENMPDGFDAENMPGGSGGGFGGTPPPSGGFGNSNDESDENSMPGGSGGGFGDGDFDPSMLEGMNPPSGEFGNSNTESDENNMPGGFGGGFSGMTPPSGGFGNSNDESDENNMPGGFGGGFGDGDFSKGGFSMSGGADLNYTDDDLDSYSTIWDGEITNTSKSDHKRVVTALKNISEGNNLEKYLDVDNVLKYMAVHTFSVNMDSLSGSMAHNYYIYEYKGQLNILPWDYNLALGGMSMGADADATSIINDAIDTPFSGTDFFDALLSNEEYLAKYHEYLNQLVEEYVYGGRFDEVYNHITSQIDSLVQTDPNAFYSYDEYVAAKDTLYEVIRLRADSIKGQLDGTIPSTDDGQRADSSSLIDASHIDIKSMGSFNMGGAS